jgi:hypothetical protein
MELPENSMERDESNNGLEEISAYPPESVVKQKKDKDKKKKKKRDKSEKRMKVKNLYEQDPQNEGPDGFDDDIDNVI